jgi:anti-sigma B factor antagonist
MFSISLNEQGDVVLSGRFDASRVDEANAIFDRLTGSARVDFAECDYISSAGLGVLLKTQKRLGAGGHALTLVGMNKLVKDVFQMARFDLVFRIE